MPKDTDRVTVTRALMLIDKEIFGADGRLIAKCWREDVGEILLERLNSQPDLLDVCKDMKVLIQSNIEYFIQLRKLFADHIHIDGATIVVDTLDGIIKENGQALAKAKRGIK